MIDTSRHAGGMTRSLEEKVNLSLFAQSVQFNFFSALSQFPGREGLLHDGAAKILRDAGIDNAEKWLGERPK